MEIFLLILIIHIFMENHIKTFNRLNFFPYLGLSCQILEKESKNRHKYCWKMEPVLFWEGLIPKKVEALQIHIEGRIHLSKYTLFLVGRRLPDYHK